MLKNGSKIKLYYTEETGVSYDSFIITVKNGKIIIFLSDELQEALENGTGLNGMYFVDTSERYLFNRYVIEKADLFDVITIDISAITSGNTGKIKEWGKWMENKSRSTSSYLWHR